MSFSIQSLYNWYRNTIRNPKYRWWLILGTIAYLFSPIDIAPDFIPIVGQIDDIAILTLLIAEVSQMLTQRLKERKDSDSEQAFTQVDQATTESSTVDVDAVSVK